MPGASLDQGLLFIYFVYGLAFFFMGLALSLECGRRPALAEARLLWPLAIFGILHGLHEWLEYFFVQTALLGISAPVSSGWIRLGVLAASFASLLVFGGRASREGNIPKPWQNAGLTLLFIYVAAVGANVATAFAAGMPASVRFVDALIRYAIGIPGGLMAALGLWFQSRAYRTRGDLDVSRSLAWGAVALAAYALTQLIVPRIDMFPGSVINGDSFRAVTAIPHQAVRTGLALLITWSLLASLQAVEVRRRNEIFQAERTRQAALRQQEALRRELLRHTVRAQEEERARIARELHDETAQTLSAFTLQLATLRTLARRRKDIASKIEELQTLSRTMSQGLFRMVHALRPAQLDDLGLLPALQSLVEHDWRQLGMDVSIQVAGAPRRLDSLVETVLFRVAQEAVSNISRHAGTQGAELALSFREGEVELAVTDRGRGFDVEQTFTAPRGWGLAGMRERIESMGGEFGLRSIAGVGTVVEARLPLDGRKEDAWKLSD